ncbi:MAG: carboxymuconolactone decarboxylase family protein [bacterium]|nr:carboxymuconolactone decarboxylase family protein [bacterium]
MEKDLDAFAAYRERMNAEILDSGSLDLRRFFALDSAVYRDGALPPKTKELLGLVASLVLRCDDCVLYHLVRCGEEGVSDAEFHETVSIALIVGGSITIPHLRRAFEMWAKIQDRKKTDGTQGKT